MKVKVTREGLLIPREVAERLGSDEVEVFEEPGRLVIVAETGSPSSRGTGGRSAPETESAEDLIFALGRNPVRTGLRDGSTKHDRYLYGAGG